MKHFAVTLLVIAAVATITGAVSYRAGTNHAVQVALDQRDAMEWLRVDFALNDAQFAAIKTLHDDYSVVCEEHCRLIQQAGRTLRELKAAKAEPTAVAAAQGRFEELRLVCETAITTHVRRCAAEMSPEAGRRYLAMVLPKIKDFDHQAPPDLHLQHRH